MDDEALLAMHQAHRVHPGARVGQPEPGMPEHHGHEGQGAERAAVVHEVELPRIERVLPQPDRQGIQHGIPRGQALADIGDLGAQQGFGVDRHGGNVKPAAPARPPRVPGGPKFPCGAIRAKTAATDKGTTMSEHAHIQHAEDKRIALLIAVLALFLALVETGAGSAQTDALARNVEATNLWAYFQARTVRQTTVQTAAEQAELQRAATADPAARAALDAQQKAWRDTAARWESDPGTGEGRKELTERARATEAERDHSMAKYHLYEYSAALFQVAIVVASASVVTSVSLLAVLGVVLGIGGLGLGAIGLLAPLAVHF